MIGYGTLIAYAGQTVTLSGTGSLIGNNCAAYLSGIGTLSAKASQNGSATLSGTGYLYAVATGIDSCSASLPALQGICGDALNWSFSSASLPALQGQAVEEAYVPAFVSSCAASLPALMGLSISDQLNLGHVSGSLQPLTGICSDYDYGICRASLPALQTISHAGNPLEINVMSYMYALGMSDTKTDHVIVINSVGTMVGSYSCTRIMAINAMNTLLATGTTSIVSYYNISSMGVMSGSSVSMAQIGTMPLVDPISRVWVVNLDTHASSQYDDYGFVSFFNDNGKSYGIAADGIYELTGTTDAGNPINALIDFGKSDYGTAQKKHVPNFYLGCGSTGLMSMQVQADNQTYTYPARSYSTYVDNHRVDVGKGLVGNYWNPVLINNGFYFDLGTITFEPVPLSRKI
jgi:hypothetical protein